MLASPDGSPMRATQKSPLKSTLKKRKASPKKEHHHHHDDHHNNVQIQLESPTSISMKNSYIIKNADPSFEAYYNTMRKRSKILGQMPTIPEFGTSIPVVKNDGVRT
jgi:hypothetical protein